MPAGSGLRASRQPSVTPPPEVGAWGSGARRRGWGGGPEGPRALAPEEIQAHRLGLGVARVATRVEKCRLVWGRPGDSREKQSVWGARGRGGTSCVETDGKASLRRRQREPGPGWGGPVGGLCAG